MAGAMHPLIFISYSHRDEKWLDYVRDHLRTAEYAGEFALWDDRRMLGGADWEVEIAEVLSRCRVCILLVSRHSLTSDYINRVEMRRALERAKTEGVHIYPIMLSSVHVASDHWLRKFNWRPRDGKPLQSLSKSNDKRDGLEIDTLLVAVGGGGLIGGICAWFEHRVNVVAVEPEGSPTLHLALKAGRPVDAPTDGIASDSLSPKRVGELMFPIARKYIKRNVLVSDDDIRQAQRSLWDVMRVVSEPGGAAAFAALLSGKYAAKPGERIAVLLCGANTAAVSFA